MDVFDALDDPLTAVGLHDVHEVGADGAAVDFAGLFRDGARDLQVRIFERFEDLERIEVGFEIAVAAEQVENPFALESLQGI